MSLDVLAQHLATKGRNGDSMLVHMTPSEVQGLHALALAHGGQLTINPETGLPEANFLKKLLPMIAGAALNFFAPGIGTAIGSALGGLSGAAGSAIAVGGITGLATGSLQKGLMAGLGAYGGASLTGGLAGAGSSAAGAASIEAAQKLALEKGLEGAAADQFVQQQVAQSVAAYGAKPFMEQMAGGINAFGSPTAAAKALAKPLMYAAAPIMADAMVPTATQMPNQEPGATGYIRPRAIDMSSFGQAPGSFTTLPPLPANRITYEAPPPGGARGGLVALAEGGSAGSKFSAWDKFVGNPAFGKEAWEGVVQTARGRPGANLYGVENISLPEVLDYVRSRGVLSEADIARIIPPPPPPPAAAYGNFEGRNEYFTPEGEFRRFTETGTPISPMTFGQDMGSQQGQVISPYSIPSHILGFEPDKPGFTSRWEAENPTAAPLPKPVAAPVAAPVVTGGTVTGGIADLPTTTTRPVLQLTPTEQTYTTSAAQYTGGTTSGGDVTTETTSTKTPFQLLLEQQQQTPTTGTITGGTTTGGGVDASARTSAEPAFQLAPVNQNAQVPVTTPTGGVVTPASVDTYTTETTPTLSLSTAQQGMQTKESTPTGGDVTGTTDTRTAFDTYNVTAPTGKPPAVTPISTLKGTEAQPQTYGGLLSPAQFKQYIYQGNADATEATRRGLLYLMSQPGFNPTSATAYWNSALGTNFKPEDYLRALTSYGFAQQGQPPTLGTAGKVVQGKETMQDVRTAVGNSYDPQTFKPFTPSVTGASQSAYDFLMGKGEYPTNQTLPGNAPLWRPYVQNVAAPAASTLVPRTGAPTAQFGFKAPTTGAVGTGTQRWKNIKTGEIYNAPYGYTPPSADWVMDTDNATVDNSTTGGGEGIGSTSSPGESDGFGPGESAKAGGLMKLATGGYAQGGYNLGSYSDGGRLLRGPGDGVSDSIPATIGQGQPARLADGEFVVPARIVSELGNGSTEAGARKLYAMMDRVQRARRKTVGKNKVAANTKAERFLPA